MRRLSLALALAVVVVFVTAATAQAAGRSGVVGSYTIADLGQGGWAGGPLYADGAIGGGGSVAFSVPAPGAGSVQEIARITGGTWSSAGPGAVALCLDQQPIKDPLGILSGPFCSPPLPVNAGPVVFFGTLVRVAIKG
jgi:hypothetical protein